MPIGVYDERGNLLHSPAGEIEAIAYALVRQRTGRLTTILLANGAEIMFAPSTPAGNRAETAIEYNQRVNAVVKEEMGKDEMSPSWLLPWKK